VKDARSAANSAKRLARLDRYPKGGDRAAGTVAKGHRAWRASVDAYT